MIPLVVLAVAAVVFWITSAHNQIQELAMDTRDAWARLGSHLRKRHDLTEDLIREVTDVVELDDELPEAVNNIKNVAQQALARADIDHGVRTAARAEAALSDVLSRLKVTLARYPDWHPRQRIQVLLQDITGTEAAAREALHAFNEAAHTLRERCDGLGWNLVARITGAPMVEVWTDVTHTSSGPAPSIREHDAARE